MAGGKQTQTVLKSWLVEVIQNRDKMLNLVQSSESAEIVCDGEGESTAEIRGKERSDFYETVLPKRSNPTGSWFARAIEEARSNGEFSAMFPMLQELDAAFKAFARAFREQPRGTTPAAVWALNAAVDALIPFVRGSTSDRGASSTSLHETSNPETASGERGVAATVHAGYFSCRDLAELHHVNRACLDQRLRRWRRANPGGEGNDWIEIPDPKSGVSKYLYVESAVRGVIDNLHSVGSA